MEPDDTFRKQGKVPIVSVNGEAQMWTVPARLVFRAMPCGCISQDWQTRVEADAEWQSDWETNMSRTFPCPKHYPFELAQGKREESERYE